jgi:hypothetical protein
VCIIIVHHENFFRSSLPTLDGFDEAKIPSHTTVPLTYTQYKLNLLDENYRIIWEKGPEFELILSVCGLCLAYTQSQAGNLPNLPYADYSEPLQYEKS